MWDNWTVLQYDKLTETPMIYIGCMTGTSVDGIADFTAAVFDETGLPICYRNCSQQLPSDLNQTLLIFSQSDSHENLRAEICRLETQFTQYLVRAFFDVIKALALDNYPKDKVILSPHGQAIDHQPYETHYYTDIIVNGAMLAQMTGYRVVTEHRQAPLVVSMAAPLAPVLIKKLFASSDYNTILLNGGGIANIAVLLKEDPKKIIGFDTGPANGPIDEVVQHYFDKPYDVDGKIAKSGELIPTLYKQLLHHEYFKRDIRQKSADRATFNVRRWIMPAINTTELENYAWQDIITTISCVIADSVADAIIDVVPSDNNRLIYYGGMSHNAFIMDRIQTHLKEKIAIDVINMRDLNYDPDFFESLLMAYFGYCAYWHLAIDLSYCAREGVKKPVAIPGVVAYPS